MTVYDELDPSDAEALREHAEAIREDERTTREKVLDAGTRLLDAKRRVGHGQFLDWLALEFDWSIDTAERLMNIAKHPQVAELPLGVSSMYLLAGAPPEAEAAIQEVIDRKERVTLKLVASVVTGWRFRHRIEQTVEALSQARPSEVGKRSSTALATLGELEQALNDDRLREYAVAVMKQHGATLQGWAEVQDTPAEIMARAGVSFAERNSDSSPGSSRGQLIEGETNHQLVVWPGPVVIAIFPKVQNAHAHSLQCAVMEAACQRVGAAIQLDGYL